MGKAKGKGSYTVTQQMYLWRQQNENVLPKPLWGRKNWFGGHRWEKECGGKIAHADLEAAIKHVQEIKHKPLHEGKNGEAILGIYRCRWCEWLHVGHRAPGHRPQETVWEDI